MKRRREIPNSNYAANSINREERKLDFQLESVLKAKRILAYITCFYHIGQLEEKEKEEEIDAEEAPETVTFYEAVHGTRVI